VIFPAINTSIDGRVTGKLPVPQFDDTPGSPSGFHKGTCYPSRHLSGGVKMHHDFDILWDLDESLTKKSVKKMLAMESL